MTEKRKTAGELYNQTLADKTKYNAFEAGLAMTDDILEHVKECAEKHDSIIDEPEYCIIMLLADDCILKGIMRRKFYAWPFLPNPRPRQVVFLRIKKGDRIKRLWSLPDALTMATASSMNIVDKRWSLVKKWCDKFYEGLEKKNPSIFWNFIRQNSGITLQSESEFSNAHREELAKPGLDQEGGLFTDSLNLEKIYSSQIASALKSSEVQDAINGSGKAKNLDRDISSQE